MTLPWSVVDDGLHVAVRLTPRAARDGVDGVRIEADGRAVLQLRIAAPPVEGAANAALIAYLAKWLGLRKSDVTILSGATSRVKRIHLAGDAQALIAQISCVSRP